MRVLVTGASGLIGRHLVAALDGAGAGVRAVVRNPRQGTNLPAAVELRLADLAEPATVVGLAGAMDAVVHLGGATAGPWPVHRGATAGGTAAMLAEAERAGVSHFLHVSSLAVYDPARAEGGTVSERTPLVSPGPAAGPYARGKRLAERCVHRAMQRGLPATIVRPGVVYGPERMLLPHLGHPLPTGNLRLAVGSPKQPLPLVGVHSLVEALLAILRTPRTIGRTYQVVDDTQHNRSTYLRKLAEAGRPVDMRLIHLPAPLVAGTADTLTALRRVPGLRGLPGPNGRKIRDRARFLIFDNRALQRDTAWRPVKDLSRELDRTAPAFLSRSGDDRAWRVGIIGAGMNSAHHLRALAGLATAKPVGILDPLPGAAEQRAREHSGVEGFTDADAFYRRARPEAVHIVSPPHTHAPLAMEALARGVYVLCEKPMATTVAECEAMTERARRQRLQLGTNHNLLFDPRLRRARRMIEHGAIGRVVHVQTTAAFVPPQSAASDRGTARRWVHELPGGRLEDLAPHALYTTLAFLPGEPRVEHIGRPDRAPADRELRLALTGSRATAGVTLSLKLRPEQFVIDIHGTRGTVRLDLLNMLVLHHRLGGGPRPIARAGMIARHAVGQLRQTAMHGPDVLTGRLRAYGDMSGLVHSFYDSLDRAAAFEVMPHHGRTVVELLRRIWPIPRREDSTPSPEPVTEPGSAPAGDGSAADGSFAG